MLLPLSLLTALCSSSSSIGNAAALVVALTVPCLSNSATGAADAVAPSCCLQATAAAVMLPPHVSAIWVEGRGVGRGIDGSLRQKRQGGRAGKGSLGLPLLLFTPNQPKHVKTLAHIPQRLKRVANQPTSLNEGRGTQLGVRVIIWIYHL
ncbi:hypothetical protein B0H34DRAFT_670592 [Crassisporium funariophilum]|nr:hypothetical protein B0H34DRAFT_670592 [Crassisporium funariophilum]